MIKEERALGKPVTEESFLNSWRVIYKYLAANMAPNGEY